MKINYACQSTLDELLESQIDFVFCGCGYEKRASYFYSVIAEKLSAHPPEKKICFLFEDRAVLSWNDNFSFYKTSGFDLVSVNRLDLFQLIRIFEEIFLSTNKKSLRIVMDYSSMTKIVYSALIKCFNIINDLFDDVTIFFSYTPAIFSDPPETRPNLHNQPLPIFPTVGLTDKKISLILNLGYVAGKAQGLVDYLQIDRSDIYLFSTSRKNDNQYYESIISANSYVLKEIPTENYFEYELANVTHILNLLESLCNYLFSKQYRVIIAPLGSKLFSLLAILMTLKYNDLTVLRVSDGIQGEATEKYPDKEKNIILVETQFVKDEMEKV